MIPRIIHQIWIGDQSRRPVEEMESWRLKHDDGTFEYKLWTELPDWFENRKAYDLSPEWAGKADILRYEILAREGGIYADADSTCLRPVSMGDYLKQTCFTCWENEIVRTGLMGNGFMGCTPGHSFFKFMVEVIGKVAEQRPEHFKQMAWQSTGPQFITDCAKHHKPSDLMVYPSWVFFPEHFTGQKYTGHGQPTACHLWGSTNDYREVESCYQRAANNHKNS